jgi:hypothetical protein
VQNAIDPDLPKPNMFKLELFDVKRESLGAQKLRDDSNIIEGVGELQMDGKEKKGFNMEIALNEDQLEDTGNVPKNLTFQSVLSEKEDHSVVEREDAIEEKKTKPLEVKEEPKPSLPEDNKALSALQTKKLLNYQETQVDTKKKKPSQIREKIALMILTVQDNAIGDLWALWLGTCISKHNFEDYIGIAFASIYGLFLILQILILCKFANTLLMKLCARILVIGLIPIYIIASFIPSISTNLLTNLSLFSSLVLYERMSMFVGSSFMMNQLPRKSLGLHKVRHIVRFLACVGSSVLLAGELEYAKVLFYALALISLISAMSLTKRTKFAFNQS